MRPGVDRWLFLTFTSLSLFASELVVEQLSVLNARLQGTAEACQTGADPSCLDLTAAQFNGLFVAHFWIGGISAIFTGFFVGKYGIFISSLVSAFVFLAGMTMMTIAPYFSNDTAFALLISGRAVVAVGYYANITLSHEVKSHWFLGKELALAFTIYISSCRLGSVLVFTTVGGIVEYYGLQITLWIIFCVGLIGPITEVVAGWIYQKYASTSLDRMVSVHSGLNKFSFSKVQHLGRDFWIIAGITLLYFGVLFTFLSDGPKYLKDMFGYSESSAGIIIGVIPVIALLAPIFGITIDRCGGRDVYTFTSVSFQLLVCIVLAAVPTFFIGFTSLFVGFSYAIITASLWSSIPIVTSPGVVGVAMGAALGMQSLGSGLLLLITGFMLDNSSIAVKERWVRFFALLVSFAVLAWVLSGLSIYFDNKHSGERLRRKHALPAMTAEMNEQVGEIAPLLERIPSGKTVSDA